MTSRQTLPLFSQPRSPVDVARLAQLVERKALNLVVVGSSPTVGVFFSLLRETRRKLADTLFCVASNFG